MFQQDQSKGGVNTGQLLSSFMKMKLVLNYELTVANHIVSKGLFIFLLNALKHAYLQT